MPLRCWSLLLLLLCVDTIPQQRSVISDKVICKMGASSSEALCYHSTSLSTLLFPYIALEDGVILSHSQGVLELLVEIVMILASS